MPPANVTTIERRLHDWASRSANERHYEKSQVQLIEAALADRRRTTQLATGAYLLGTWHLASGQSAVLRGDMDAWSDIRIGASLQRTSMLLRSRTRRRQTRHGEQPDLPTLQAANCVAMSLALDDPGAEPLYETFRTLPNSAFHETSAYPLFVKAVLMLRANQRPTLNRALGSYGEIIRHWNGEAELLARRLAELLDIHLGQTQSRPGHPADFGERGVQLFPLEVLMVKQVRATMEEPMPKVEHPLMFTNLATTHPRGPWPSLGLLEQLERRLAPLLRRN